MRRVLLNDEYKIKDQGIFFVVGLVAILFFNDQDLQIIKIDGVHKTVLVKPGLGMPFEFGNRRVQPDRRAQIELVADLIQRMKYFVCAGVVGVITDDQIPYQTIFFDFFSP